MNMNNTCPLPLCQAHLKLQLQLSLKMRWLYSHLIQPPTHPPPIRRIKTMTFNVKQRTKSNVLDELHDELDKLYEIDELGL